jgi:hypothetical protein
MKYFLIRKSNQEIVSYSESKDIIFDTDKFELIEKNPNKEETDNLKNNKYHKLTDEEFILKDEVIKTIDIREKIEKAKTINELKNIILNDLI